MNLDDVRIATPCPASWADMNGDERKRFCDSCKLHVYNLAGMTRPEVEALVSAGDACLRLYRRKDGTVITKDCPVGLRKSTRRFIGTMAASVVVLFGGLLWGMNELRDGDRFDWSRLAKIQPFKAIAGLVRWAELEPPPTPTGRMIMGKVAPPRK